MSGSEIHAGPGARLEVFAPDGIGEVTEGTDLAALVAEHAVDGDVALLTSKVVSKAEGRVATGDRDGAIRSETVRVVARRGGTAIVENHLGLVMAAAGVDASNVATGRLVLLPLDPDATARAIREAVRERTGANVAVIVTDTAGRAWRHGQTDLAIGAAGIEPLDSFEGRVDAYGNELAVTAPAVGDEIASAAELASGKLGGRPLAVVRGLAERVLPAGEHGPGARSVVRETGTDMFGLGSREAVVAALTRTQQVAFGAAASPDDLLAALAVCGFEVLGRGPDSVLVDAARTDLRLTTLAFAFGWRVRATENPGPRSADSPALLAPLS
ncbi:coenzyme F420-0:L-glutamate ligase [Marmoricola sp. RAF53]|uniref:coenzyme F420-0:L-glutamate ligase n=1 Tax=Marmoricola sp. RAF53 TaxID=3233059 RepID=UPI003F98579F